MSQDNVNSPTHYAAGKIEVAEACEDWKLDAHSFNVVKYVARAGKKDPSKEIEDLEKAEWYLSRRIELLTAKREGRAPCKPNEMPRRPKRLKGSAADRIAEGTAMKLCEHGCVVPVKPEPLWTNQLDPREHERFNVPGMWEIVSGNSIPIFIPNLGCREQLEKRIILYVPHHISFISMGAQS